MPKLTVCIPTYNRSKFLRQSLDSLISQIKKNKLANNVEIIISDNASRDDTNKVVQGYIKNNSFIRYFRNRINVGGDINLFLAASHARGDYIWFFSDDDQHYQDSLTYVLKIIDRDTWDVILVNMDLYSKDMVHIEDKNLFRNKKDIFVKTKKDYFRYLETKFFLPFDWHIGVYSNTIVSKKLFSKNNSKVLIYNGYYNQFAHSALFYYLPDDYKIYMTAKSLIKFRADNREFGPKDRKKFLIYWYPILDRHYMNIIEVNKKNISLKFRALLVLKIVIRKIRILLLSFGNTDIAGILIRIFYKDSGGKRKKWSISV